MTADSHEAITELRKNINIAQIQLVAMVMTICPGPHHPTQKRDRKPPWCLACGRTADGVQIREIPAETTAAVSPDEDGPLDPLSPPLSASGGSVGGSGCPAKQGPPEGVCCDSHNAHCEPPGELCCHNCTECAHDSFPIRHGDGSRCVLDREGT